MTETHTADSGPDESESIKAAKRGEAHAANEAARARADAEAAGTEAERLAEALGEKRAERDKVKTRCEELKERVSRMSLDDPAFEEASAAGLEIVRKELERWRNVATRSPRKRGQWRRHRTRPPGS